MTKEEFLEKYHLHFNDFSDELHFFNALDKLYIEFTSLQAIELLTDYLNNADDIYNECQEQIEQGIITLEEITSKEK